MDMHPPEREEVKKTGSISNSLAEAIHRLGLTLTGSLQKAKPEITSLTDPREEELVKRSLHEMEYRKARALGMIRHQAIL